MAKDIVVFELRKDLPRKVHSFIVDNFYTLLQLAKDLLGNIPGFHIWGEKKWSQLKLQQQT